MHYVRVCWIWSTCNWGKRVAAWKHPGMAAVGREPCTGQESQVAKSGELYTACNYCVLGKLALALYAVLGIFLTERQLRPPFGSLQGFSLKLRVNIDVLTWCAWHLVGRCTLYETLAKENLRKRWSVLEIPFVCCQKAYSDAAAVTRRYHCGIWAALKLCWGFFPMVLPGIYDLSIWVLPRHYVTCMQHPVLCQPANN